MRTAQQDLVGLFEYATNRLVARLDGLTDAEYRWEPVAGCWSVRQRDDGTWHADIGPHGTAITEETGLTAPPFTTIAWRMWHLGATPKPHWPPLKAESASGFVEAWFGQSGPESAGVGTAAEAIDLVRRHWEAFSRVAAALPPEEVADAMGPAADGYGESSVFGLLLHIVDELIHHGAEIGVVRDLYRAHDGSMPSVGVQ